ncbi:hypothetical protein EDEG_01233 [Edhazardia aedis USNM 41457]|uniref:SCP domain-containing protein n=1 Tax=Edhazardia aedis (strain USNM 41457) TaxID=1003232 RepID=J9DPT3_EDHAE|nr:hypothetical protein EDEG_01233 [Edhazardia aedis USNM 41457]|eukprot:EJW04550.1 hypothetical protein EDEG_01233 [Edhazardia aedis USNM 41457]
MNILLISILLSIRCDVKKKILKLVNKHRKKGDLAILNNDRNLNKAAQIQAEYVMKKGAITHENKNVQYKNPVARVIASNYSKNFAVTENIMYFPEDNYKLIIDEYRHKKEMAMESLFNEKYKDIGIGLSTDATGRTYYTLVYCVNLDATVKEPKKALSEVDEEGPIGPPPE